MSEQKRQRAVYVLRTQHENAGDLMINDLLLREINKHADVEIDDDGVPADFSNALTMRSLPRVRQRKEFSSVRDWRFMLAATLGKLTYRYLVLKPGDQSRKTRKSRLTYRMKAMTYLWLAKRGVKLVRLGTSFGRLDSANQALERRLQKSLAFSSVRDTLSNTDNNLDLPVVPDMAFLIDEAYRPTAPAPGNYIVFSFRRDLYDADTLAAMDRLIETAVADFASDPEVRFLFVAQVHRDAEGMRTAAKKFNDLYPGRAEFIEIGLDLERAFSLYKGAKLVISNRLHVALTTLVLGGRAVACVERKNDRKIWGLFQDQALDGLLCFYAEEDGQSIEQAIARALTPSMAEDVAKSVAESRTTLQSVIEKVFTA